MGIKQRIFSILPLYFSYSVIFQMSCAISHREIRGLSDLLREEVAEAFEQRKELAREQGEKAATRLLFPMVLTLAVVMLLVLVPAGMSMQM